MAERDSDMQIEILPAAPNPHLNLGEAAGEDQKLNYKYL